VGLALAALCLRRPSPVERYRRPFAQWYLFWVLVLVTPPLLDLATHWGTAFFAPFSDVRYGVPAVPVIEPVYTLILLAALAMAFFKGVRTVPPACGARALALFHALCRDGLGPAPQGRAPGPADLDERGIEAVEVHAYTTILRPWLRRLVAVTPEAHLVGFVSTLRPEPINWVSVPRDSRAEALKAALDGTREGLIYFTFANGPIHAALRPHEGNPVDGHELQLYDLRFGFPNDTLTGLWGMTAFLDAEERFVRASRFSVESRVREGDSLALFRATLGLPQDVF
jgi:inner membrane protein